MYGKVNYIIITTILVLFFNILLVSAAIIPFQGPEIIKKDIPSIKIKSIEVQEGSPNKDKILFIINLEGTYKKPFAVAMDVIYTFDDGHEEKLTCASSLSEDEGKTWKTFGGVKCRNIIYEGSVAVFSGVEETGSFSLYVPKSVFPSNLVPEQIVKNTKINLGIWRNGCIGIPKSWLQGAYKENLDTGYYDPVVDWIGWGTPTTPSVKIRGLGIYPSTKPLDTKNIKIVDMNSIDDYLNNVVWLFTWGESADWKKTCVGGTDDLIALGGPYYLKDYSNSYTYFGTAGSTVTCGTDKDKIDCAIQTDKSVKVKLIQPISGGTYINIPASFCSGTPTAPKGCEGGIWDGKDYYKCESSESVAGLDSSAKCVDGDWSVRTSCPNGCDEKTGKCKEAVIKTEEKSVVSVKDEDICKKAVYPGMLSGGYKCGERTYTGNSDRPGDAYYCCAKKNIADTAQSYCQDICK